MRRRPFVGLRQLEPRLTPTLVHLDVPALANQLLAAPLEFTGNSTVTISLPRPDGTTERFAMWRTTMMEAGLAAQLPSLQTYRGQSLDRPANLLAADVGPNGFHAKVSGPGAWWYIDPRNAPQGEYVTYVPDAASAPAEVFNDSGSPIQGESGAPTLNYSTGPTLRTFRLAVAATGEYTQFSGGTVVATQANIVTLINRINLTLERDVTYRFVLVANNTDVIFTNPATDPFTNSNLFTMTGECQTTLDSKIGLANYDIGHVFGSDGFGGGIAYFGIGRDADKGKAASKAPNWSTPTGVPFEGTVTHEMGHQAGAHHTFNGVNGAAAGNRTGTTAVEVGSGSTIMSYCGSTGPDDLQAMSDLYYHSITYDEIQDFIAVIPAVGGTVATGNTAPTVFAGLDATIPAHTPFSLNATANDVNGDTLTYSWEERDTGPAQALGSPDNGYSPLFRAFAPVTNSTRVFPNLTNLTAGTPSKGETLPTTNRNLNFRVYVRDNRVGGGGVTLDDLTLNVVNTGSAFKVTSPNTGVSLPSGSSQLITWNVAGTTAAPINTTLVNIRLSTDGGLTYPTLLAANTANDGTEPIVLPTATSSTARIKVEAVGNYFFDISDVNFSITAASVMRVASTSPTTFILAPAATLDVTFTQNVKSSTIDIGDLVLSQGTVSAAVLQNFNTARYTLSGLTGEGVVTITMPAGAVTDPDGKGVAQFIGNYAVDVDSLAFPTPLIAANPVGSLVYGGNAAGRLHSASDTDSFTITLDAGQSLSITMSPDSTLQPMVTLTGPGGVNVSASGAASGQPAAIAGAAIIQAGVYTITAGQKNITQGEYSLRLDLNAMVEAEPNDTTGTATSLASSQFDVDSGKRFAWTATLEAPSNVFPVELEPNNSTAAANDVSRTFVPYAGNLYHMGVQGTVGSIYFKLGQIETADIFTGTMSAKPSSRGTMTDPNLYILYNGNQYAYGWGDDAGGPGNEALINRFVPDVTAEYFAAAFGSGNFGQTFQFGFVMENSGTPPLTTESITKVTVANNSYESAADLSKSWRQVQYRSRTAGTITAGDVDVLRYQFTAGDLVTLRADSMSDVDLQLTLRNSAGTLIATDDGSSNGALAPEEDAQLLGYVIPTTGVYYVEVKAASGIGSYNVDTLLSAKTAPPAPVDYAAITLTAGQTMTVGLEAQPAGNLTIDLVDITNKVLASGAAGATNFDRVVSYVAPSTGPYYLRVQGDGGVTYTVTANVGIALEQEANDSFGTAQSLINSRVLGGIAAGSEDWYQFTAAFGQIINVTTLTPGGASGEFVNNLDPIIELYTPSNKLVTSDDNSAGDGKNAKLIASATETGAYRVRVRGFGSSAGEYSVTATAATVAAKVATVEINGGVAQRSRVTTMVVTFDQTVTLPANPTDAFQLNRNTDNAAVTLNAVQAGNAVTLTFTGGAVDSGSLADGRYTLTILAAQVNAGGFDGNGDGTPGDNYLLVGDPAVAPKLYRLFGDADGDNDVDTTDFGAFRGVFGGTSAIFDFDNDGDVDTSDFGAFRARFGGSV